MVGACLQKFENAFVKWFLYSLFFIARVMFYLGVLQINNTPLHTLNISHILQYIQCRNDCPEYSLNPRYKVMLIRRSPDRTKQPASEEWIAVDHSHIY